ncbi:MAG: ISAs1 family transposase [Terracoccus sp.]
MSVGWRVIAIDGKTVRGARTCTAAAPHLVAAFDHVSGTVLGQVAVAAESNEIPAVRDLLACFDLTGVVVTVDAMHTQTDTATAITGAGGDYVFTVQGNTPTLHLQLKALPWKQVPPHRVSSTGHGRRTTRTIKVVAAPGLGRLCRRHPGRAGAPNCDPSRESNFASALRHRAAHPDQAITCLLTF